MGIEIKEAIEHLENAMEGLLDVDREINSNYSYLDDEARKTIDAIKEITDRVYDEIYDAKMCLVD